MVGLFLIPNFMELFSKFFLMSIFDNIEIGKRLKNKRLSLNFSSARRFAQAAGIDVSQYTKIEKGDLPITDKVLDKLILSHNLDKNEILFGTNVPHETNPKIDEKPESYHTDRAGMDKLIDSVHIMALSNQTLSQTNERLSDRVLTADYDRERWIAAFATVSGIQEVLIEVTSRVKNISKEEASAQLGIQVNKAVEKFEKSDTLSGVRNRGKAS